MGGHGLEIRARRGKGEHQGTARTCRKALQRVFPHGDSQLRSYLSIIYRAVIFEDYCSCFLDFPRFLANKFHESNKVLTFVLVLSGTRHFGKIEALCSLVNGNVGNFQRCKVSIMVLRVYHVDCYSHFCISGFLRPPLTTWHSVHVSLLTNNTNHSSFRIEKSYQEKYENNIH